jgi:hypothetical protein
MQATPEQRSWSMAVDRGGYAIDRRGRRSTLRMNDTALRFVSVARYTSPMPPTPIWSTIS